MSYDISKISRIACAVALLAVSVVFISTGAYAHGYGGHADHYQAGARPAAEDVSDQEISAFARAQQSIGEIQEEYSAQIAATEDPMEEQMIVQEANEKMVEAVQSEGLDVMRYNTILNAAQNDPDMQRRIMEEAGHSF